MVGSENFYSLLKVTPKATVSEIIDAYHAARNAFSKESLAAYSLFSEAEVQEMMRNLDDAYRTLTNPEKRQMYDKSLHAVQDLNELKPSQGDSMDVPAKEAISAVEGFPVAAPSPLISTDPAGHPLAAAETISGDNLRALRERRGLSLADVARVTKIPTRYIKAIEGNDPKALPARVYLQGFVKNLASLYHEDPSRTAAAYLAFQDKSGT